VIGWRISQHSGVFKVLFAALLVLSITAIPLPQTSGWWQGTAEAAPPDKTPEGQLKRRGIVGVVLSVDQLSATSTPPVASSTPLAIEGSATSTPPSIPQAGHLMIVGMQHGDVRVIVPEGVRVHAPHQEDISLLEIVGMKVAILANKAPINPDSDDEVIRTVTAKKVMIIPSEAVRTHGRGIITAAGAKEKGKGKFKLLGEDGEEQEIEIDDDADLGEGDDIIFVKHKRKGHGNATTTPITIDLSGFQNTDHIAARLANLIKKLLEGGDTRTADKLIDKVEKYQAKVEKHLDKLDKEILRLESTRE
jgi:hypothetical protein